MESFPPFIFLSLLLTLESKRVERYAASLLCDEGGISLVWQTRRMNTGNDIYDYIYLYDTLSTWVITEASFFHFLVFRPTPPRGLLQDCENWESGNFPNFRSPSSHNLVTRECSCSWRWGMTHSPTRKREWNSAEMARFAIDFCARIGYTW